MSVCRLLCLGLKSPLTSRFTPVCCVCVSVSVSVSVCVCVSFALWIHAGLLPRDAVHANAIDLHANQVSQRPDHCTAATV